MGISSAMGVAGLQFGVIADAAARPASPFEGQAVYQKDNNGLFVYDGAAWTPPWNTAWGLIGKATATSSQVFTSNTLTDFTNLSVTFTAVTNRNYKISFSLPQAYGTSENGFTVHIVDTASIFEAYLGVSTYGWSVSNYVVKTYSAGSVTVKLRGASYVGANNVSCYASASSPMTLLVEDIGPA